MLGQIDTPFDTFIADGAYDGERVSQAVLGKQTATKVNVPPHKTAVCPPAGDSHIQVIDQYGRIAWQKKTDYGLRNYAELSMQRYKRIFGNTMKERQLPQQKAEAWASAVALYRMTGFGMPVSVKIRSLRVRDSSVYLMNFATKPVPAGVEPVED